MKEALVFALWKHPFLSALGITRHQYTLCTDWSVIWFDTKISNED
jgi:hypothetical protein